MNDDSTSRDTTFAGPGRPAPTPASPEPLDLLAVWLERRLHDAVGWRHGSRLYGLTVLDRIAVGVSGPAGDGAVRLTFLAEGWVYDLLESPSARLATEYDALGLCCFGKATNLDTLERTRCRTVLVADASGLSTVNRMRGKDPERTGRPSGPVADLVTALFHDSAVTDRTRRT